MTDKLNGCREAFEGFVQAGGDPDWKELIERDSEGNYINGVIKGGWIVWLKFWPQLRQHEMRVLNDVLPPAFKYEIADNITTESRSKSDVVQDVWDELVQRGLVRQPTREYGRHSSELPNDCCRKCEKKRLETEAADGIFPLRLMVCCHVCGNKRCPKASDHDLACTGSNEPNQPGSVYQTEREGQPS